MNQIRAHYTDMEISHQNPPWLLDTNKKCLKINKCTEKSNGYNTNKEI
jgi:hypothetical protein